MPYTDKKMIISGKQVEVFEFYPQVWYGVSSFKKRPSIKKPKNTYNQQTNPVINYESLRRARLVLLRLLESNIGAWQNKSGRYFKGIFITLTFADNITDLTACHKEFTKFIARLNYKVFKTKGLIKYLAVPEFHKKRDVIHYHVVIFNLPYMTQIYDEIRNIWARGHTLVKTINNPNSIGIYLSKYLTKQYVDKRFSGRKKYFCSRGLKKSLVIRKKNIIDVLLKQINQEPIFSKSYGGNSPESNETNVKNKIHVKRSIYKVSQETIKQMKYIIYLLKKYDYKR